MKNMQLLIFGIIFGIVWLVSCTPPDPCDNPTGNMICMGGDLYETNDNHWHNDSTGESVIIFQVVPGGGPLPSFPLFMGSFSLFDSNYPAIPAVGTYTGEWPDSIGMDFYTYIGLNNGGSESYFYMDTTTINTLVISESTGTIISGNIDCWVYNYDIPSDKRRVKISFEDLMVQ